MSMTIESPPGPNRVWLCLESVPGGTAFTTIWRQHLGSDFAGFKALFLKSQPGEPADSVPCPWNCGCLHKVVPEDNGRLLGKCQCETRLCGDYTVMPEERICLEIDWPKLGRVLCGALGAEPRSARLGLYNTFQIGSWSAEGLPVVLSLCSNPVELLNAIATVTARFGQPFILLTPTGRHLGAAGRELIASAGAAWFALAEHVVFRSRGEEAEPELSCTTAPKELFAGVVPVRAEVTDEELARRTFLVLQQQEAGSRRKSPSLYTVFQLYCIEELTIPQTARKCRCSVGTVANRLKLLRARTGVAPERLRGISAYFTKYEEDFRRAHRNYGRGTGNGR
jgi:hypothetical protein